MKRMVVVEGLSGSGKSTLSKFVANALNLEYVNLDVVAKSCYEDKDVISKLKEVFPETIFNGNRVDFKGLASIVFNDSKMIKLLEGILYPCVTLKVEKIIEDSLNGCVLDGIKVHETSLFEKANYKIFVRREKEERIESLVNRDSISKERASERDNAINFDGLKFDCVIDNYGSLADLKNKLPFIISEILNGNYCLYAGSFDPLTNGHLELIRSASKDYDYVFVGIGDNPNKKRNYDKDVMADLINESLKDACLYNAYCFGYKGYTGEMANKLKVKELVRGIRNEKDEKEEKMIEEYNYEHFKLKTKYYIMKDLAHISSTYVRDRIKENLSISDLVPKNIEKYILEKDA